MTGWILVIGFYVSASAETPYLVHSLYEQASKARCEANGAAILKEFVNRAERSRQAVAKFICVPAYEGEASGARKLQ